MCAGDHQAVIGTVFDLSGPGVSEDLLDRVLPAHPIAAEDLGKLAGIVPTNTLPTTGAAKGAWPPAILALGGVILIALGVLGRQFAVRAF